MAREIWKDIAGFSGFYQISNRGRIRGIRDGHKIISPRIMKTRISPRGYVVIGLSINQKRRILRVHRMLAATFIGDVKPGDHIRHLNGNKRDNRLKNLAIGTAKENAADGIRLRERIVGEKHYRAKLKEKDIIEIRRCAKSGMSNRELANKYNIGITGIYKIVKKVSWKHI